MRQFYLRRGVIGMFLLFTFQLLLAQSIEQKLREDKTVSSFKMNAALKTPSSISFEPSATISAGEAVSVIQRYFSIAGDNVLKQTSSTRVQNNIEVIKFKQVYKGINVEHSAFSVITKNGNIQVITAEAYSLTEDFPITPQLSEEEAKTKALNFVSAEKYAWEALEEDKKLFAGNIYVQMQLETLKQQYLPKGEVVIAKDQYGTKGPRLAYKFDVFAVQPLSRYIIFVDALDGRILLRDAVIKHVDDKKGPKPTTLNYVPNFQYYNLAQNGEINYAPPQIQASVAGTGLTRYAGVRQIFTTKISVPLTGGQDPNNPLLPLTYSGVDPRVPVLGADVYILKDDTRGGGIETYDCSVLGGVPLNLPQIQAQAIAFVDKDNDWKNEIDNGVLTQEDLMRGVTADGSNGVDEALNDDIAIDAHWGAGIVYDYWKNIHNRLSYDNKNSTIRSYVHYGPAYDNAFWNGSSMTYGDGSGTLSGGFRPLVSLDVCGHEIGHGVCSFTSDLVYESESGAMNEGLSDIWAAAVERYAKINVDPTLDYHYFQIGEQISADNIGLRRMDAPKSKTDPDTYGGRYWANPDCTPSLANDQCGVHTNSGVLNKWFYLMVQGPLTTTGSPAFTDDGVADKPRTTPAGTDWIEDGGNNYGTLPGFIGIGFDKAEQITYLMELALTPNAKFADAREASINAAVVLYGVCSQEVITVTNAWYAVNVGAAWGGCTAPTLSVQVLNTTVTEGSGDCGSYSEYTIGVSLAFSQGTPTTVNFTTGGTAEDHDFDLSASSVTFNAGETGSKTIKLLLYNDDMVESEETITINASSALGSFNSDVTITVIDDDVMPKLGNTFTLLTEDFESVPNDALPTGWAKVNKTNPTGGEWNVRQSPGASSITWTTKRAYVYNPNLPLIQDQATYDSNVDALVILRTRLIDARGLDSIRLQFIWSAGGEGACDPACDYGRVVYSWDGINFNQFDVDTSIGARTASEPLYLSPVDSTYDYLLPGVLSNKQFYIGFMWLNDALATISPNSITIDNIVVSGQGRKIETDSTSSVTTPVHVEPGNPVFFYSERDKGLLSSMINASADLGCVKDTLVEAGPGTVTYPGGRRTKKVHEITPSQNSNATYTLTLYYTTEDLAGFVLPPSQLKLLKSNAADIDLSNTGNSEIVTPIFVDSSSQGFYIYTYTFSGFSLFALIEPNTSPLPVNCIDFKANRMADNTVNLLWKVANDEIIGRYEVERSGDGFNYQKIAIVAANGTGQYNFTDVNTSGLRVAYYRLKHIDADGSSTYVCKVIYVSIDGRNVFSIGNIYPNPGKGEASVNISISDAHKLQIEYVNSIGQIVTVQNERLPAGATKLNLKVNALASGNYLIRFKDEDGRVVNTQQFIKQ